MAVNTRKEQHAMWTKDTESFTADELITGTAIAAKIISEGTGLRRHGPRHGGNARCQDRSERAIAGD